jgi:Methyltransferase domain
MDKSSRNSNFKTRPAAVDQCSMMPLDEDVDAYVRSKYGEPENMGPSPRLRYRRGYVFADDYYECLVSNLVSQGSLWIDIGCGRDIFPSNLAGAKLLADRAELLVGVDPDPNVFENDLLDERFQGVIEDYQSDRMFDLVTMRMVAEHVVEAEACVAKLSDLTKSGGHVVIYTPWKWAPMSLAASVIPFAFHNRLKRLIWDSEEQDTFPTAYKMNTRKALQQLFATANFEETLFSYLDDCSVTARYLRLNSFEIFVRNMCLQIGLPYPEQCLLAVYRKK